MIFRAALSKDLTTIESILKQVGLPFEDCKEHIDNFILAEQAGRTIGTVGIELYKNTGLLRSIAVLPDYRNQSLGAELFYRLKAHALQHNIKTIYLLTETAKTYFEKQGFNVVSRDDVPEAIKQTTQFSSLCPASAAVMKLVI